MLRFVFSHKRSSVALDYTYDANYGRLEKVIDPLGNYLNYGYDGQGNIIQSSAHTAR